MNRIVISGTIVIIALMIGIPTFINVKKDHEEKLLKVTEMEIKNAAKRCYLEGVCKEEKITLAFLYEKKYLEAQINPVTKKYYNETSTITYLNKKIVLDLN